MNPASTRKPLNKMKLLLPLLFKHPLEFYDRVSTFANVRSDSFWPEPTSYSPQEWRHVLLEAEKAIKAQLTSFLKEPALEEIEKEVRIRVQRNLSEGSPFLHSHNADFTLARTCYLICRATRPAVVLETGVAYGVTSAFILKALGVNGKGVLHSADLPPLGNDADHFVGIVIPAELKHRWRLHRGTSKRVLPSLLQQLEKIDIFVHDSLHTYRNIQRELSLVTPHLTNEAVVIADDVGDNSAFWEWTTNAQLSFSATVQESEKKSIFGIGMMSH